MDQNAFHTFVYVCFLLILILYIYTYIRVFFFKTTTKRLRTSQFVRTQIPLKNRNEIMITYSNNNTHNGTGNNYFNSIGKVQQTT